MTRSLGCADERLRSGRDPGRGAADDCPTSEWERAAAGSAGGGPIAAVGRRGPPLFPRRSSGSKPDARRVPRA